MYSTVTLALLALVAYWSISRGVRFWRLRRFASVNGCQPPARIPQRERIIGYGLYKEDMAMGYQRRTMETTQRRFRELGNTFSGTMVGQYFISTIEAENIKAVLSTQVEHFDNGKKMIFGPLLGDSILTSDGATWKHGRTLVRPHLVKERITSLESLEVHIKNFFACIPKDGSTVDLQPLFSSLTLDNILDFMLNGHIGSLLSEPGSKPREFAKSLEEAQMRMTRMAAKGPFLRFYRDPELERACKEVHEYIDQIILKAREKRASEKVDDAERGTFLDDLLDATDDLVKIRSEIAGLILAGRDTAADTLSNMFFILARRPDVWKKLQTEVKMLNGRIPSYDDLKQLTYHRQVIDETMRFYSPVPVLFRSANQDTTLPRGGGPDGMAPVLVPQGTLVSFSTYSLHRRKDVYGEDADEFRPERWDDLHVRWEYLPFSAGARVCMGQMYALAEMAYILARTLQEFDSLESRSNGPWVEKWSITLSTGDGTKVGLIPRIRSDKKIKN